MARFVGAKVCQTKEGKPTASSCHPLSQIRTSSVARDSTSCILLKNKQKGTVHTVASYSMVEGSSSGDGDGDNDDDDGSVIFIKKL